MSSEPKDFQTAESSAGPQELHGDAIGRAEKPDAEERLRLFIDHAPLAIAMFDRSMRYLHVSRRWRADYGLGDRDLRGLSHYEVFPEISEDRKKVHARALAGETVRADGDRFVRANGSVQWLRWEVLPWRDGAGDVGGIVIFTEDITEATAAARKARETADWLQLALQSAGAGAWEWNVHTNENVWSPELWKLYGLKEERLPASLSTWLGVVVPEDREQVARLAREAAIHGDEISLEFRVRWPDGSIHHLLSRALPFKNGDARASKYLGIVIDVTERKRVDEMLRTHEREQAVRELTTRSEAASRVTADRLRSAIETIEDGFVLFDDADRLVLCNEAYRALLRRTVPLVEPGMSYEELITAWSSEVSHDDEERARYVAQRLAHRKTAPTVPFDVRTLSGRILRISNRRTPEGGFVSTVRDLTDDLQQADELRRARTAAEAGSTAKSEFMSSMSHELRTPLNAILGFAQLLQREKKEPLIEKHRARVDHILESGEHLLRLIDDVLDLSRIESGRLAIAIAPVDVASVLAQVKTSVSALEARYRIHVEIEPMPASLPAVAADRTRFLQILINFCSNALKYNREGGKVRLTVSQPAVDRVRVTVSDTGIGIPPSKRALIFQPFQRAGQETGPIEGTGIGLVITRRLAKLMAGEIDFVSVEGEGSSFWIDLPASPEAVRASLVEPPSSENPLQPGTRLVLYVEDNPANVAFMRDALASLEDVKVVTAPTAKLGVEIACRRRPKAIIVDVDLEGSFAGIETMRMLRGSDAADIPVLALSTATTERDRARMLAEGFRACLARPLQIAELLTEVDALLAETPT